MAFATGSRTRIAFVPEATYDTSPTSPVFVTSRVTGAGMRTTKSTGISDELQPDRNVRDEFLLGLDSAGTYDAELSYGTFDTIMEAALGGTWAGDVLKNGAVPRSFTIEETLELGTTDSFSRFTGAVVNTFGVNLTARQAAQLSIGMMARRETLATAILSGATYTAPNENPISTASAHVASLDVASLSPAPAVRAVSFEVNNNYRIRPVVGSLYTVDFGMGRCDVTGTLEAYFESNALYQAVLDHGGGELSFTIGVDTGEKYTFEFPNIKFLNGERRVGGNNDDVMVSIPFRALYSSGISASMQVTRAVA